MNLLYKGLSHILRLKIINNGKSEMIVTFVISGNILSFGKFYKINKSTWYKVMMNRLPDKHTK